MRLSMRWAERCREAFGDRPGHALFGIQQGGVTHELRAESAEALTEIGFDGYAVGGLAVGEGQEAMFAVLDYAPAMLPEDKPRYLMGVGKPDDIVGAVARGIDMIDCVLPSRSGRTGQAFTRRGPVNIKNARHADDPRPLDEDCACPACRNYSRAYLHHVFKSGEIIASMLLTWHNLHYYQELMAGLRAAIAEDRLAEFEAGFTPPARRRRHPPALTSATPRLFHLAANIHRGFGERPRNAQPLARPAPETRSKPCAAQRNSRRPDPIPQQAVDRIRPLSPDPSRHMMAR